MNVIPFAFEEQLVRVVQRDGDAWFVGRDVCASLGIKNHADALGSLDDDEKGVATTDPLAPGGEQCVVIVSEPGVYRLVFRSRKPEAERFKRWLAHDVLPRLRRGESIHAPDASCGTRAYGTTWASEGATKERISEADLAHAPLLHRLHCLREVRAIAGRHAARVMWNRLGLPPLPPPPPTAVDEARECLRHVLDSPIHGRDTLTLREAISRAFDDELEMQALCLAAGVRVLPESEAFVVANDHPWLRDVFKGSAWAQPRSHVYVLRRLPGAVGGERQRYGAAGQRRGTLLPGALLDEG